MTFQIKPDKDGDYNGTWQTNDGGLAGQFNDASCVIGRDCVSTEKIEGYMDQLESKGPPEQEEPPEQEGNEGEGKGILGTIGDFLCDNIVKLFSLTACQPSPIILDLNGDGVKAPARVYFDHAGDGFAELSTWVKYDGLLVFDRNGDGKVNSGAELFGNYTPLAGGGNAVHGFHALAEFDSNKDGKIDALDKRWGELQIMHYQDPGEGEEDGKYVLSSLEALGIKSISTKYVASDYVDEYGNAHRQVGSYTTVGGIVRAANDVWLHADPKRTLVTGFSGYIEGVDKLPEMAGSGMIYTLRQAISMDESGILKPPFYGLGRSETRKLRPLVEAFVQASTVAERKILLNKIIMRWTGAEGVGISDYWRGRYFAYTSPQKLAVVEAFSGQQYYAGRSYRHPGLEAARVINSLYLGVTEHVYAALMQQSHYKELFSSIKLNVDGTEVSDQNTLSKEQLKKAIYDLSGLSVFLQNNPQMDKNDVLRVMAASILDDYSTVNMDKFEVLYRSFEETSPGLTYGFVYHLEYLLKAAFDGNDRFANEYRGAASSNGEEVFRTTDASPDKLIGLKKGDTYQLGYGTGSDTVYENFKGGNKEAQGVDIIKVMPGVAPDRVRIGREGHHLRVSLLKADNTSTDSLLVYNYFVDPAARIEKVVFEDGTEWDSTVLQRASLASGPGTQLVDHYKPVAASGEKLQGREGNDVYHLGLDTGDAQVEEYKHNLAGSDGDVIRLASGLGLADISLSRSGLADLVVSVHDAQNKVVSSLTISDFYRHERSRVERIEDAAGNVLLDLVAAGAKVARSNAALAGTLLGYWGADGFAADGGNDYLVGKGGDDTYHFGLTSDHDTVDELRDNVSGGDAGDRIVLAAGLVAADVKLMRAGDDLLVVLRANEASLRVKNHFLLPRARVERIEYADGSLHTDLTSATIKDAVRGNGSAGGVVLGNRRANFFASDGGNDTLVGMGGNDTYYFGFGAGDDVVREGLRNLVAGDGGDRIVLAAGVKATDLTVIRAGLDLVLKLKGGQGSLTVRDYYGYLGAKIERIEYADGSLYANRSVLDALTDSVTAPNYKAAAGELAGSAGNDYLYGRDDTNDLFNSAAGGNDHLYGGAGYDIYVLGKKTGFDTVYEGVSAQSRQAIAGDHGDTIRIAAGLTVDDIRLVRDQNHAWVQVLGAANADGVRSVIAHLYLPYYYRDVAARVERIVFAGGAEWGIEEFMSVVQRDGAGNDYMFGRDDSIDFFDSSAGGNDYLYGGAGADIYILGAKTGFDTVYEGVSANSRQAIAGDDGDTIRIAAGLTSDDIRLVRDQNHAWVQVLGAADGNGVRAVVAHLYLPYYYRDVAARVERIVFAGGAEWGIEEFMSVVQSGGAGNDYLFGRDDASDIFDGSAGGNDYLYGGAGDDIYILGAKTGFDQVIEGLSAQSRQRIAGDDGDTIRIAAGLTVDDIRLARDQNHAWVQVLGSADGNGVRAVVAHLYLENYYNNIAARVERVVFSSGVEWGIEEFLSVVQRDGPGNDYMFGRDDSSDGFDSSAGGNDYLYGGAGNDIYILGARTGFDQVIEGVSAHSRQSIGGDHGDMIRIAAGLTTDDIRLVRDQNHVWVQVLGAADGNGERAVIAHLFLADFYNNIAAQVERIVFASGAEWGIVDFYSIVRRGGKADDILIGRDDENEVFDANAGGNDKLVGLGGDDEYRLGFKTGYDAVYEGYTRAYAHASYLRPGGDAGDVIRVDAGITAQDVVLVRDTNNVWVQLLGAPDDQGKRQVVASLQVVNYYLNDQSKIEQIIFADGTSWGHAELHQAPIRGGSGDDTLYGRDDLADIFDGNAGGNDNLVGLGGNDEYRLGAKTGHDVVYEGYTRAEIRASYLRSAGDDGDIIRLDTGYGLGDLKLERDTDNVAVQLLGAPDDQGNRAVIASLKLVNYYANDQSKIERIVVADGSSEWGSRELHQIAFRGGAGDDTLYGRDDLADIFDGNAGGNDNLVGLGGNDEYRLGAKTGHDVVYEGYTRDQIRASYLRSAGDDGDIIRLDIGYGLGDLKLERDTNNVAVQLLGAPDDQGNRAVIASLKLVNYYANDQSKIERIVVADGSSEWGSRELHQIAFRGGAGDDTLYGRDDLADIFDGNAGGNDNLVGLGGKDEYRLGAKTGHDVVYEGYTRAEIRASYLRSAGDDGDIIRLDTGYGLGDLKLERDTDNVAVQLLGAPDDQGNRAVIASLKLVNYYANDQSKIERIVVADGSSEWGSRELHQIAFRGGSGDDTLIGRDDLADIIDANAGGNDNLVGLGGNDEYRLGAKTDHDVGV